MCFDLATDIAPVGEEDEEVGKVDEVEEGSVLDGGDGFDDEGLGINVVKQDVSVPLTTRNAFDVIVPNGVYASI